MTELYRKYQKMDYTYDELFELFLNYNSFKTRGRRTKILEKLKQFDANKNEFRKVLMNEYLKPTEKTMWKPKE
jgi:hypothetical protein